MPDPFETLMGCHPEMSFERGRMTDPGKGFWLKHQKAILCVEAAC
ncbi:hypothetical protein [Desulfatiglans anilini]|nr:hypothetical protein [Desulfatiglans anilini]